MTKKINKILFLVTFIALAIMVSWDDLKMLRIMAILFGLIIIFLDLVASDFKKIAMERLK